LISTPHKTRTFTVRLSVTTNTKKNMLGRGVGWMRPPTFHPNRFIGRRVIASTTFSIFPFFVRHLEFKKKVYTWSRDCYRGLNLLWCTKFHKKWFTRLASIRP